MTRTTAKQERTVCFEQSPAMTIFRQSAGHANRFLNTIVVGLETLKVNDPVKPLDLVLPWAKPESDKDWNEARDFAIRGTMISVVDALDQYLRTLTEIQGLVAPELYDRLNGRKGPGEDRRPTLPNRIDALCSRYSNAVHPAYPLATSLLAAWRNKLVHSRSKEGLSKKTHEELLRHFDFFRTSHGGTDIGDALLRYDNGEPPTLAQVSTLIASSHNLVKSVDSHLLHLQDVEQYVVSLTRYILFSSSDPSQTLETLFFRGGTGSAGSLIAAFLTCGGNNHMENRTSAAPAISRKRLDSVLGMSRNDAARFFGVARPKTGPGG